MDGHLINVVSAEFLTTAVEPVGWPKASSPEIAFAGRSNVGKSSMINALCRRRKLVRVSNTPGRTRTLNFFDVVVEDERRARHTLRFCDLPGYGFAKASKSARADWGSMIESYLKGREGLQAVVCIVDANVGPTKDDEGVVPWVLEAGRRVIVAATKLDRVPKHRRLPRIREIEQGLGLAAGDVIGVSATEDLNMDDLWHRLLEAVGTVASRSAMIDKIKTKTR
jgi:GTP-binding protein